MSAQIIPFPTVRHEASSTPREHATPVYIELIREVDMPEFASMELSEWKAHVRARLAEEDEE